MIMASRALQPHTHEHIACGVCQIIKNDVPLGAHIALIVFVNPMAEVAGCNKCIGVIREKFIARNLFFDEKIIGFICVETFHNIVAV